MKTRAFTLIELVIVITIIGILSAIAVPLFISQTSNARAASMKALAGSLMSTASMIQAAYMAKGGASSGSKTVTLANGTVVLVSGAGYPAAVSNTWPQGAGIGVAINLSGFVLTPATQTQIAPNYFTIQFNLPSAIANCNVTYNDKTGLATANITDC